MTHQETEIELEKDLDNEGMRSTYKKSLIMNRSYFDTLTAGYNK